MVSVEEVEEILPYPIRIDICCDVELLQMVVFDSFNEMLVKHNKKHDTKIERIAKRYFNGFDDGELDYNEFGIHIGKQLVFKGKGPEAPDDEQVFAFYESLVPLTEVILDTWHDDIIIVQELNEMKLKELKAEGYDEMLYMYYSMRSDRKAFQYLKRLAARYPNSNYMRKLRTIYHNGMSGWHRMNPYLYSKSGKRSKHENF